MRSTTVLRRAGLAGLAALALTACQPSAASHSTSSPALDPLVSASAAPTTTPAAAASAEAATAPVASGPAAVASIPPVPAGASGRTSPGGVAEPDRRLTPGSVLAASTVPKVCTSGYTRTVRNVPTSTREQVYAAYAIAYPPAAGSYELDHLIPLELGGDNAVTNLWPQPYHRGAGSADVKDHLENHLHALVCSGQVALSDAQQAIAGNWWVAAAKYNPISVTSTSTGGAAAQPGTSTTGSPAAQPDSASPAAQPDSASSSTSASSGQGNGATAQCNDGTYSYAAHHQGACSHHGGVQQFYK